MPTIYTRRNFIRLSTFAAAAVGSAGKVNGMLLPSPGVPVGLRVGIIGLDVSHSVAFTKLLNSATAPAQFGGYKVVAAYPKGSNDIAFSVDRIPGFTKAVADMGVEIVPSIADLLTKVDVVLLNTNDGRLHLKQVLPVLKAGKPVFIDKPLAASLADVKTIFNLSKQYKVPVFSSSSLRYMENKADLLSAKTGKILGVDTFSPATIEITHPDLFWYGIHGVEMLYTLMGTGCKEVRRIYTPDTDIVTGIWNDGRIGTFRGTRTGPHDYGGTVFGEKATMPIIPAKGFDGLMNEIVRFFQTGISPVNSTETIEIYAFMQAADESKKQGGVAVNI
jgi:hypothetical protein